MDYSKLSDFEINYRAFLLRAKQGLFKFEDIMAKQNPNKTSVIYGDGANWLEWDGCNNQSDAWPIILESKISLLEDDGNWEASIDYACDIGSYGETEVCSRFIESKNPLRAAMIVYLMMQEQ